MVNVDWCHDCNNPISSCECPPAPQEQPAVTREQLIELIRSWWTEILTGDGFNTPGDMADAILSRLSRQPQSAPAGQPLTPDNIVMFDIAIIATSQQPDDAKFEISFKDLRRLNATIKALDQKVAASPGQQEHAIQLKARIQELLEANNWEVGRRRRAELALDALQFDKTEHLGGRDYVLHDPIENLDALIYDMGMRGSIGIGTVKEIAARLQKCKDIMKGPPV